MAYITGKDLQLGYDGRIIAGELNFKAEKGDYLCIVGENGAGKSTLVKTLLGLQAAMGGEILMGDGLLPYEIGYLPQQSEIQRDFPATVWEIVLSGCLAKCGRSPFFKREEKALARKRLEELGMWQFHRECYRKLSGGQQQRVLLARALCAATRIVLLDEPVSGLDPKAAADFYYLLHDLNQQGMTIIMVSHDIQALQYATHVLHISGSTSFYGSKKEYMESDKRGLFQYGMEGKDE